MKGKSLSVTVAGGQKSERSINISITALYSKASEYLMIVDRPVNFPLVMWTRLSLNISFNGAVHSRLLCFMPFHNGESKEIQILQTQASCRQASWWRQKTDQKVKSLKGFVIFYLFHLHLNPCIKYIWYPMLVEISGLHLSANSTDTSISFMARQWIWVIKKITNVTT